MKIQLIGANFGNNFFGKEEVFAVQSRRFNFEMDEMEVFWHFIASLGQLRGLFSPWYNF